jgi:hypothetical protein
MAVLRNPVINHDLNSWKEIAAYLGVTVRAAQKWERDRGLPVYRLPGKRSVVSACREDIDRWKTGFGQSATVKRYFILVTIGHAVMLAIFLFWWFSRS